MIKVIACLLVWLGCLLPYLASPKQVLTHYRPSKLQAWFGFVILLAISFFILGSVYSGIIAAIIMLVLVMCSWIITTLLAGHFSRQLIRVSLISAGLLSFITLVGGHYGV
jgi:Zn-dependent protease with chaperone function